MDALDVIEESEARDLAWGLLDESWTRESLVAHLRDRWVKGDPEACVDDLLQQQLLFELPGEWPNRYRTRMSEAVRLFSRLRQLFPNKPWQTGSRLVSDVRFLRRPRMFSVRNILPDQCLDHLKSFSLPASVLDEVERLLKERELSRFQLDAAAAVISAVQSGNDRGVVVSAGTGSGKTLAFYLPALAQMSASSSAPRAVAIYPRNELLKDQFATALNEIRKLRAAGGRRLTIGAYFGPTPWSTFADPDPRGGWRKEGRKWVCPFLTCPSPDEENPKTNCGGALWWVKPQGTSNGTNWGHLRCFRCGDKVQSDEVLLTRNAIQQQSPDILFTTTEMLNQQLSDGWSRHVFGVGQSTGRSPNLVLLDEIHTYAGTSGAQVAFLLRRWRKLLGKPVTWVGLSATLANAQTFFADLCGVDSDAVSDIRPDADDLKPQGSEYQVLLRGDPASQTALLSTTIQSLMLLRRFLNERGSPLDLPYGTKVFAFLENLDLVNRLYRQLLSAEGRDPIGRLDSSSTVLATLRNEDAKSPDWSAEEGKEWDHDGQHWWIAEQLGFGARALEVSRTSSQDTGVNSTADIVVATSSLEVGYDDPQVGAVLQHKAPRDTAQFLQRKGRAGRLQTQRPWTVVVLSDYGRDRLAFQSYESILDPSMPTKSLPLGNQAVRKMQAAMCLVDWLAERLGAGTGWKWSARTLLARPTDPKYAAAVDKCLALLHDVMMGGPAQKQLVEFVRTSLGLTNEETWSVCWEHPRSLLLEAVPTAYRRLQSRWATVPATDLVPDTDVKARQPLPDFIPTTLFSDLELPEVEIEPPADYDQAADTELPIGMGLTELTPGKVTLRWAVQKVRGLWIEAPESGIVNLDDRLAPGGEVVVEVPTPEGLVPVVRPIRIRPEVPPPGVASTSNGRLRWKFLVDEETEGTALPRPRNGPLGELLPDVRAFLNVDRGPLRTWRYALDGEADVLMRGVRLRRAYTFEHDEKPAAVGFESTVDALMLTVTVPETVKAFSLGRDQERLRQLRTDLFTARARQLLRTLGEGKFSSEWITDVVVPIAAHAAISGSSLRGLITTADAEWRGLAEDVVDGVLLATTHTTTDETPLKDMVLGALERHEVINALRDVLPVLNCDPDESWLPWLRARFLQTIAAAWQSAAQQVCLDFNVDTDALVDVLDQGGPTAKIVLSDAVPGGGGLVEVLTRRISDDPRRFDGLVAAAVEPSDTEEVDPSLRRALDLLADNESVVRAAALFRNGPTDRLKSWQSLISVLSEQGVPRTHVNLSMLSTRIFRPGSGTDSDSLLRLLLKKWDEIDEQAGFATDYRAVSAFLAKDEEVLGVLKRVADSSRGSDGLPRTQSVLLSLLWTRACARRPETLRASNRFVTEPPLTERTLLRDMLPGRPQQVDIDADSWRTELVTVLRTWGSARILSGTGDTQRLMAAVRDLMVAPLEIDWLHAYPHLDGVTRDQGVYSVAVTLQEAPQ